MSFAARVAREESLDVLFILTAGASGDARGFSVAGAYGSVLPSPLYIPGGTLQSLYYQPDGGLGPAVYLECSAPPPLFITEVDVYYDSTFEYTLLRVLDSELFFIQNFTINDFFDTGIARVTQLVFR